MTLNLTKSICYSFLQFSHLDLVHIGPDDWMSEQALHSKRPWRAVLARRRWRSGYNAGGSPAYIGNIIKICIIFNLKTMTF